MYKTALKFLMLTLAVLFLASCAGKSASLESEQLLSEINKATTTFEGKLDILNARPLFIHSVNRSMAECDSLVMVESIDQSGEYQCVSYTSHNKMITFYNARKGQNGDGRSISEFAQAPIESTPYEALSFIDAHQNGNFDQFYKERNKEEKENMPKKWVISFVSKDEGEYSVKSLLSQ